MESDSSWGVVLVDVFNSKLSISAVEMDLSETYLLIDWSERRLPLQNFFFFLKTSMLSVFSLEYILLELTR